MTLSKVDLLVAQALGSRELRKLLARAERNAAKASESRAALPPGSSRARVTTSNARWARAAEARDRCAAMLASLTEKP